MRKLLIIIMSFVMLWISVNICLIFIAKFYTVEYAIIHHCIRYRNSEDLFHEWISFSSPWGEPTVASSELHQVVVFNFEEGQSIRVSYNGHFLWEDFIEYRKIGTKDYTSFLLREQLLLTQPARLRILNSPHKNLRYLILLRANEDTYYDATEVLFYELEESKFIQFNRNDNSTYLEIYLSDGSKYLIWIKGSKLHQDDIDYIMGSLKFNH